MLRDGVSRDLHICERKSVADDPAPTRRSKFNDRHAAHYSGCRFRVHSNAVTILDRSLRICFHGFHSTMSQETPEPIDIVSTRDGYDRWAEIYDGEGNPLIALEE